ncbi:hypothetical protein SAMN03159341_12060 [Paenibacillus sp. 1_12]|uniref:GAF domain-containing sensor histidine kinase n=1 Tax=Paenibacillus sp. 1_12 TaxID=1566278 RepID=UPI0008F0CA83|nr:GAF domain-containing sensor histidine kinase [Paenibacillus sp. 1_12]SFM20588.1 hypothetical protein SAMN03159341_12060 [Paenibacillus sp. 1_12]
MTHDPRVQELITLKTIAETLNQSTDLKLMLGTVLEKLLSLTELTAGWIFVVDGPMEFECMADRYLPPALLYEDKLPMRCDTCWCLDRYSAGRLHSAVNILNCKRLENAMEFGWGDTYGITHHATVPLYSGERQFGVMNVAAPGKKHFSDEELALLQAVALQIGSTLERMRLYAAEQRRADLFARLGEFSSALAMSMNADHALDPLMERIVKLIGNHFEWPIIALIEPQGNQFVLHSVCSSGDSISPQTRFPLGAVNWLERVSIEHQVMLASNAELAELVDCMELQGILPLFHSALAATLPFSSSMRSGILIVGSDKTEKYQRVDRELLEVLAEHITVTIENARLEEKRHELARLAERNRLARDMHDSVSQLLFSLSMTAKGVENLLGTDSQAVLSSVRDMQSLSQQALKEMRALILQLRPTGLEEGLISVLQAYGEKLNLRVNTTIDRIQKLPPVIEEVLWRIGQEALNNVCKHAGTSEVEITVRIIAGEIVLRISDKGRGIAKNRRSQSVSATGSLGLSTMRERAEALQGRFTMISAYRKGTTIEVAIPLPQS